jgi:hypothetical protein
MEQSACTGLARVVYAGFSKLLLHYHVETYGLPWSAQGTSTRLPQTLLQGTQQPLWTLLSRVRSNLSPHFTHICDPTRPVQLDASHALLLFSAKILGVAQ